MKSKKEQVFDKCFKHLNGYAYISPEAVKSAALKAMKEYAALQVKPWRTKVRKLHDENYRIKTNW